jgi:hypothetical protein
MTAPARRIVLTQTAPGWCDQRLSSGFRWRRSLYATFGPKNISGRLTNDRLFDWKVIAFAIAISGTAVALEGSARTQNDALF